MIPKLDRVSIGQTKRHARGLNFVLRFCLAGCLCALMSCSRGDSEASFSCLTDTALVDQYGQKVSLASLKGKPLIVDFIYTSCPGPCLMETAKFANVALRLGNDLGSKATIVSISVDPEHDGPKELLAYAQQQGADEKGWYFLTGSPTDVDRALAGFRIAREKGPDGSVGHLENMILVGADGKEIHEYNGAAVKAQTIVDDIKESLKQS